MNRVARDVLLSALAAISFSGASAANAAAEIWTVNGGTFDDGGTFSGSFTYDESTQAVSDWNILTTSGSALSAFDYTDANSTASADILSSSSILFLTLTYDRYFQLDFVDPLAAPGTDAFLLSHASWECDNCTVIRFVTGGSVTSSAVPEPATWAMMLLGFSALGLAFRRRGQSIGGGSQAA